MKSSESTKTGTNRDSKERNLTAFRLGKLLNQYRCEFVASAIGGIWTNIDPVMSESNSEPTSSDVEIVASMLRLVEGPDIGEAQNQIVAVLDELNSSGGNSESEARECPLDEAAYELADMREAMVRAADSSFRSMRSGLLKLIPDCKLLNSFVALGRMIDEARWGLSDILKSIDDDLQRALELQRKNRGEPVIGKRRTGGIRETTTIYDLSKLNDDLGKLNITAQLSASDDIWKGAVKEQLRRCGLNNAVQLADGDSSSRELAEIIEKQILRHLEPRSPGRPPTENKAAEDEVLLANAEEIAKDHFKRNKKNISQRSLRDKLNISQPELNISQTQISRLFKSIGDQGNAEGSTSSSWKSWLGRIAKDVASEGRQMTTHPDRTVDSAVDSDSE